MEKQFLVEAISALKKGEIIVYPTDTLYGLGADIFNEKTVKNIFQIKHRPLNNPLSIAVSCAEDLEELAYLDEKTLNIIKNFLPGCLTIVLKKKDTVPDIVTACLSNVAVRIPDNKTALKLLSDFGPLTCTSANIHGQATPTVINDIRMQFKEKISVYLDEGKLDGKPSTIVDLTSDEISIIREGTISKEQIMDVLSNG
jgi:L-threonylcarbamoyladenylate synthase